MRTVHSLIFAAVFLNLMPALSPAEVRVTLKNGRSFIADFCRVVNGKMVCDMQGGTMAVPRKDIASIREVSIRRESLSGEAVPEPDATAEEKKPSGGPEAEKKEVPGQPGEGRLITGLTPEQAKQLDQINERKTALQAERDRLATDRDQLYEDVKNTGVVKNQEQIDEIKKRIADLEMRIEGFNEAVKKLNSEEERILQH